MDQMQGMITELEVSNQIATSEQDVEKNVFSYTNLSSEVGYKFLFVVLFVAYTREPIGEKNVLFLIQKVIILGKRELRE